MEHTTDSDCTINPETDCCVECGVYHGDNCPHCGERAFHADGCIDGCTLNYERPSEPGAMAIENLILKSLLDAARILDQATKEASAEPMPVFLLVCHAREYINAQLDAEIREDVNA